MALRRHPNAELLTHNPINFGLLGKGIREAGGLSGQVAALKQYALLSQDELYLREQLAQYFTICLNTTHCIGQFRLFGSSANSLGFKDNDIDMFFELEAVKMLHNGDSSKIPREEVFNVSHTSLLELSGFSL